MKYYTQSLEATMAMTAYQFFSLVQEIEYLEDPHKHCPVSLPKEKMKKLQQKSDFEEFLFG
jgi:hypothetical protein